MMPLNYAKPGESYTILKVGGKPDVKKHLEDLGFHVGETISIISTISGNLIVNVKDSRVAIDRQLAGKIMI